MISYEEYYQEIRSQVLVSCSTFPVAEVDEFLQGEDAQHEIKQGYENYTAEKPRHQGCGSPDSVSYCLSLMF